MAVGRPIAGGRLREGQVPGSGVPRLVRWFGPEPGVRHPVSLPAPLLGMLIGLLIGPPTALSSGDPSKPGAYCPFPKKGEKPACFEKVETEYPDFLAEVNSGQLKGDSVAEVERALQGETAGADQTLALSSLAYGYYMLAQRTAASDHPDPALVSRLERWNELLGTVYEEADQDPELRAAVKEAALDLHASVECAEGESCPTTGTLLTALRGIDDPASETGIRGALGNLLRGMMDSDGDDEGSSSEPAAE